MLTGIALIVAGVIAAAIPLFGLWHRSQQDQAALDDWNKGGSSAIAGAAPSSDPSVAPAVAGATGAAAARSCGSNLPADQAYALVTFPSLPEYGYAGVAGDGTWDLLTQRSMVHYKDSAAPGAAGNSIIAMHREPGYIHIDQLKTGDTIDVQDRACKVWHYKVTDIQVLSVDATTSMLTSDVTKGPYLTLVTCTPIWVDTSRITIRAQLVG